MKNYFYCIVFISLTFFACSGGGGSSSSSANAAAGTGGLQGFTLVDNPASNTQRASKTDANGVLIEQGEALNGKRVGTWMTYYDGKKAGVVKSSTSYVNDVIQGTHLKFDNIGRTELRSSYSNGQLHGPYIEYKYGKPVKESNYNNGQLDGMYRTYYQNGTKQQETEYSNGKKNGRSVFYNENEEIIMDYQYKNDEKVSGGAVTPPSTAKE